MKLQEALEKLKAHGKWVTRKGQWTEYTVQHHYDKNGDLCWTAGMTAGGKVGDRSLRGADGINDFCIYQKWGDLTPIEE